MLNKPRILVVEDDKAIKNFITTSLETQGYDCIDTAKGKEAIFMSMSQNPDIIILDLGLPDIDGVQIVSKIREYSKIPIIVVSARDSERQKVELLDKGADDYLTKPFGIEELLARVRVALRNRIGVDNKNENKEIFKVKDLVLDFNKRKVMVDDKEIHLTPIEYSIMTLFSKYPGKVLTHNFIINKIWGSSVGNETQSLRVFMANLRRKIEKDPAHFQYIQTEVGVGYRSIDE